MNYKMLAASIVLVTFTSLRLGPIGVGEVIFLLSLVYMFINGRHQLHVTPERPFSFFFLCFIPLVMLFYLSRAILGARLVEPHLAAFDLAAYILALIAILGVEAAVNSDEDAAVSIASTTFALFAAVLCPMHLLSLVRSEIFGLPLRTYHMFTPLVENVHQISMVLLCLPFLGVFLLRYSPAGPGKLFLMGASLWFAAMVLDTSTSKGLLGLIVGSVVGMVAWIVKRSGSRQERRITVLLILMVVLAAALPQSEEIVWRSAQLFLAADTSDERQILYKQAISLIITDPVFGRGPGPHTMLLGEPKDTHQSFLTAYLQGGVIGFGLYVWFWMSVARRVSSCPALLAMVAAVSVYAAGGDMLRRIPGWLLLLLAYSLVVTPRGASPADVGKLSISYPPAGRIR